MITFAFLLAFAAGGAFGFPEAILYFTGASCLEELDSTTLEKYERLHERPLRINEASRSRLQESGLFSAFQLASLLDARERTGDILSETELSLLDGFTAEFVRALAQFVDFGSSSPPGTVKKRRAEHDIVARGSWSAANNLAGKASYLLTLPSDSQMYLSSTGTLSAAVYLRRSKIIVGDFNARFGQGVLLWSGVTLSGLSTLQAFRRNPSLLSPAASFGSTSHRGVAADFHLGKWTFSAALSLPGLRSRMDSALQGDTAESTQQAVTLLPMAGISLTLSSVTLGATAFLCDGRAAFSGDFRAGLRNLSLFGEFAWDKAPAMLVGGIWHPVYGWKTALLARYYSADYKGSLGASARAWSKVSDEAGCALGLQTPLGSLTLDYAFHPSTLQISQGRPDAESQLKAIASVSREFGIASGALTLTPTLRAAFRRRPWDKLPGRTDVRCDLYAGFDNWSLGGRYNAVWCNEMSWLWFAEVMRDYDAAEQEGGAGAHTPVWRAAVRFTLFKADSWDDRIYAWERDVPQSFSVPACYGRGFSLSLLCGVKWRHAALHLRGVWRSWPWNITPKEDSAEVKMLVKFSF